MPVRLSTAYPRRKATLAALGVLFVLLPIYGIADSWFLSWERDSHRQHVESQLSPYADRVASSVRLRFGLLHSVADLVALKAADMFLQAEDIEDIDYLIRQTISYAGGIRNFALAPGGLWSHVYPRRDGESTLGDASYLNEHPEIGADMQRSVSLRRATMSGPWSPRGDSITLVGLQPIYEQGFYWGLVAVEMDLRTILDESKLPPGLAIAVRDSRGQVFFGPSAIFESQPVVESVDVPGGRWEVAGVPSGGWSAAAGQEDLAIQVGGLIIVGLLASLAYLMVGRESLLAQAVEDRTRQLSMADAELKTAYRTLERRVAVRTRQLSTIYEVTALASTSQDLEMTLKQTLERTVALVGGTIGIVQLLDGSGGLQLAAAQGLLPEPIKMLCLAAADQGLGGRVVSRNDVLTVADISASSIAEPVLRDLGPLACVGVPIRVRDAAAGSLTVVCPPGHQFGEDEIALLLSIGRQIGVAVESARLMAEFQGKAVLEERQRLARDLHDSVAQLLYSLTLMAAAGRRLVAEGNLHRADEALVRLRDNAQQALREMRLLVYELRPLALEKNGLAGALQERLDAVERRVGVDAHLQVDRNIELSVLAEEELYRIAQEALNNALKHAAANVVKVTLYRDQNEIVMEIADDGAGFSSDPRDNGWGLGMTSMRERAERLGASLAVRSKPGSGTTVTVRLSVTVAPQLVVDRGYPSRGGEHAKAA